MKSERHKVHYSIILAAGNSTRMGMPKWSLKMPGGDTFLNYIATGYLRSGITPVVVVSSGDKASLEKESLPAQLIRVENPYPEKGRMYSLQCGLQIIHQPACCFIHNIDNPFVSGPLLSDMPEKLQDYDYLIPEYQGRGGHPVLISPFLFGEILQCKQPLPVLRVFLKNFNGLRLPVSEPFILLNINTSEDYQKFLSTQG
jgi:molybdenum cofactor cytidylyltransferase